LGGGFPAPMGFGGGRGADGEPGGRGGKGALDPGGFGGGTKGLAPEPASSGAAADDPTLNLVVSFLGATPIGGGAPTPLLPGKLIRTVSRLVVGVSDFAGSVMRIVSAFDASSGDSEGAGGTSSGIGMSVCRLMSPGPDGVNTIVPSRTPLAPHSAEGCGRA
jgi:hypothetical protein